MAFDRDEEILRIQRELQLVTAERDRLLEENIRLKSLTTSKETSPSHIVPEKSLGQHRPESGLPKADFSSIHSDFPLSEKIGLYRSLFRGRDDVYARLWQNKRNGKIGYSPVCRNEWNRGICQKPYIKCSECNNRDLSALSDSVIQSHLEGKIAIGLYPLLEDDTCYFLAVDFDKTSWRDDASAFLATCAVTGIPAALEQSRSGNGGHVWIFFSEPVLAAEARKLGSHLLTETMSRYHHLGMDSYDRLFPNQDTVPKGGFGNLIALPLQKRSVDKGNTIFLDSDLKPYLDQWNFLTSIKRVDASTLGKIVRKAEKAGGVLGECISTDDEDQPWKSTPSKHKPWSLSAGSFPDKVNVVISNMIFIEKSGLPSALLNKIKRLAVFQNPEFYKKQSLRLSTARTPRIICCAEEFPKHLGIPRGCFDNLMDLFNLVGIEAIISEERFADIDLQASFHGQLNAAQEEATSKLLEHNDGILVAPSGSGKTVIGISMIASRKTNTLILVHRRPLVEQWRNQLASFLDIDLTEIGQVGGGKDKRNGLLDVAMLQSLIRKGEVQDIVAEYGHVVIDECHHLPAFTFEQVLRQIKARYVLGLTATPYRRDGHHPIITMQCGPQRHEIRRRDVPSQNVLQQKLICRHTNFMLAESEIEPTIQQIYSDLIADEARNTLILDDILKTLDDGRSPILLTERREHLEFFSGRLAETTKHVVVLRGGMGNRQRRAVAEQLASIPENESRILLATGRYIGEGFDDARLDTLFLALPVSWKGTLTQYAGRLHRMHSGKNDVRIYDYVDKDVPMLLRMFQRRLRGYRAMGYITDASTNIQTEKSG